MATNSAATLLTAYGVVGRSGNGIPIGRDRRTDFAKIEAQVALEAHQCMTFAVVPHDLEAALDQAERGFGLV